MVQWLVLELLLGGLKVPNGKKKIRAKLKIKWKRFRDLALLLAKVTDRNFLILLQIVLHEEYKSEMGWIA